MDASEIARHIANEWVGRTVASSSHTEHPDGVREVRIYFVDGARSSLFVEPGEVVSAQTMARPLAPTGTDSQ